MVELLANGNLSASTGVGATSVAGPGWQTSYVACGPNLFAAPCGAQRWAFFTTNAGQVTGNYPGSTLVPALNGRSMMVNVGPNPAVPIIEWLNVPLVNGRSYRFRCDAAKLNDPFSVALRINGVVIAPLVSPPTFDLWTQTDLVFTWTGATGNHSVSVNSNSGVAGGNDHAFDNFSLTGVGAPCGCCPTGGQGTRISDPTIQVYSCVNQGVLHWYDADGNEVAASDVVIS